MRVGDSSVATEKQPKKPSVQHYYLNSQRELNIQDIRKGTSFMVTANETNKQKTIE